MRTVPSAPSKTPDAFKMPSPSTGNVVGSMPVMCVYSLGVAVTVSGILEAYLQWIGIYTVIYTAIVHYVNSMYMYNT